MGYNPERRAFPSSKLVSVVELLEQEDVPAERALRGIGLSRAALLDPSTRISARQLLGAYRNAMTLSRQPDFALKLGFGVQVTFYGIYGFAMLSCPTHRDAIEFAVRYHGLSCATAVLGFQSPAAGPHVWTVKPLATAQDDPRLCRFVTEVNAATIVSLARDIVAPSYKPALVRFAFPRPAAAIDYRGLFGCDVLFDQPVNEVTVPADWLERPTRRADRVTFGVVGQMCDRLLRDEGVSRDGVAGDLQRMMIDSGGRFPTIEEAALRLGVSPRTLRRKLAAANASYGQMLSEARAALAKTYLQDSMLTVEDIAERVGYSDASNFRHAFIRWVGMTPTQYRRATRSGDLGGPAAFLA